MYRLLVVTDQPNARKSLKAGLLEQGCSVTWLDTPAVCRDDLEAPPADVLVLDLEGVRTDAHKLCHTIKRDPALKDLPLILLVTEAQLGRVDFSWGIDDYLTLPVSVTRLVERVKFLLWKLNNVELNNGLKVGHLTVDFERYEVHLDGEPVDLTYKEFELLKFLATHPGRVFNREALLNKVWGYDFYGGTRTVDVHIRRLRAKIEAGGQTYIETIRNVGYKFISEATK